MPDVLSAPTHPPKVYLVHADQVQEGNLINWDWLIDDEIVSVPVSDSITWPSPLATSGSQVVRVKIVSEAAPAEVSLREYTEIDHRGFPVGNTITETGWLHPGIFNHDHESHDHDSSIELVLTYVSDDELPGWEFELPPSRSVGNRFITIWATWQGPFSANWNLIVNSQ